MGKTIDKALYNANPDFWDSHNMSTLNPETWNEVSRALEGTPGGFVFDMLFGTSPEGNTTQAYMDEQQLAYLAWYMQNQGVFTTSIQYPSYTPGDNVSYVGNDFNTVKNALIGSIISPYKNELETQLNDLVTHFSLDFSGKFFSISFNYISASSRAIMIHIYRKVPKTGTIALLRNTPYIVLNTSYILDYYVYQNNKYTHSSRNWSNTTYEYLSPYIETETGGNAWTASLSNYGQITVSPAVTGTGTQPAATTPDLSTATSVSTALELLKAQFPELWRNAVTNTVLQPDGAIKTFTYVPVPTPEAATALDPQPVTGPATQANPQVNPETAPSLKDLITNIIPTINPSQNKPDIGAGNTPTVVPQTGKASSLYSVYNPSQEQLNQFGAWLWSSDFFEQIKKLFNDPMQAIIGLHKVYSPVQTSGLGTIKCG